MQRSIFILLALLTAGILFWLQQEDGAQPTGISPEAREAPAPRTTPREDVLEARSELEARAETESAEVSVPPLKTTEPGASLEAGCLEVLVLRHGAPVSSGTVHLVSDRRSWLPPDPWSDEKVRQLPIGVDGIARAAALAPGIWLIGAEVVQGEVQQERVRLTEEKGQRVVIELGGASLSGHVYDSDGAPVEGARVQVGSTFATVVWSDALGAYRVNALPEGTHWASARLDGNEYSKSDFMLQIAFADSEQKEHDFGRSRRNPRWTGVVRNRADDPVPGAKLHVSRRDQDGYSTGRAAGDGTFQLALEPGTYDISLESPSNSNRTLAIEGFVIAEADIEQDLVLPGTRVAGKVHGLPDNWAERSRGMTVSARIEGKDYSAAIYRAEVLFDGSFVLDGLGPGKWLLTTWPDQTPSASELTIREVDVEHGLDLQL